MRHEASFLRDILDAPRKIEAITAATSEEVFLGDEVLPAAVLHHLTVMGEAISRLSPELQERHPEVPWHQIVAVRHRIVYAYFDLDWQILKAVSKMLTTFMPKGVQHSIQVEFSGRLVNQSNQIRRDVVSI